MFYLRDTKSSKKTPIFLLFRKTLPGKRIFVKYHIGYSILPANWNKQKKRAREIYGTDYRQINRRIKETRMALTEIMDENPVSALSGLFIKKQLGLKLGVEKEENSGFFEFFDNYINEREESKGYEKIKSFRSAYNKIKSFKPNLTWDDINYEFYLAFIKHMEKGAGNKGYKEGYSINYIGRVIKDLKIILSHAVKLGLTKNEEFRKFKVQQEYVYNIYLSEKELEAIYGLSFEEKEKHLEIARDLFLVGCYTGMRVENYLNIDPDVQIDKQKKFITTIVNKGGPKVKIPIHWIVREILDKYNGLPKSIAPQKLNKYIKVIGGKAEINETIIFTKTIGGKRKKFALPKYKLITSHTARRSLATNLYLRNAPLKYIMSITGHRAESQCLHYIKTSISELADKVAELDFWKKG